MVMNITKTGERAKGTTNLGTAVSFVGSSKGEYKIVMQRTDFSEDGMNYIRGQIWNKMYESSGAKEIVEQMESGNEI